ncbi:hypothetical protein WN55_10445 [Dufourea novaeangliae]|uniref:Uncharacterized protein n=1 Tax=Dufourea novaeangliae TaxID=178035 RepID=A0A154P5C6_DUFNO|nr:hypothetical protein WN55_10445 [Dufourea novaeangliae]
MHEKSFRALAVTSDRTSVRGRGMDEGKAKRRLEVDRSVTQKKTSIFVSKNLSKAVRRPLKLHSLELFSAPTSSPAVLGRITVNLSQERSWAGSSNVKQCASIADIESETEQGSGGGNQQPENEKANEPPLISRAQNPSPSPTHSPLEPSRAQRGLCPRPRQAILAAFSAPTLNDAEAVVTSLAIPISSGGNYVQRDASRSQYPPSPIAPGLGPVLAHVSTWRRRRSGAFETAAAAAHVRPPPIRMYTVSRDSFASGFRHGNDSAVIGSLTGPETAEAAQNRGRYRMARYRAAIVTSRRYLRSRFPAATRDTIDG